MCSLNLEMAILSALSGLSNEFEGVWLRGNVSKWGIFEWLWGNIYLEWVYITKNGSILNKFGEICIWMSIIEERNLRTEWIWGNVYLEWVWIRKKGFNEVEEICF